MDKSSIDRKAEQSPVAVTRVAMAERVFLLVLLTLGCAVTLGCGSSSKADSDSASEAPAQPPPNDAIAVLYYDDESAFCEAFKNGAESEAEKRSVKLQWLNADDADSQAGQLQTAIDENFAAICLCPLAPNKFGTRVTELISSGTPVVICEKPLLSEPTTDLSVAASDHFHSGQIVAEKAAAVVGESGKVLVVLNHHPTAKEREMGVRYGFKESQSLDVFTTSDIELKDSSDEEPALPALVAQFIDDEGSDQIAIVTLMPEDAMLVTDWKNSEAGSEFQDVPVYGFGATNKTPEDIRAGTLTATILEDPYLMGVSTIMAAADQIDGKDVSGLISTGEHYVDADNLDDDRSTALLQSNLRN